MPHLSIREAKLKMVVSSRYLNIFTNFYFFIFFSTLNTKNQFGIAISLDKSAFVNKIILKTELRFY
jgi:hypothetical protein